MKLIKFRLWLASISKRTWIYVGCIAGFVALAIVGLLIWMHLCGYTISSWLSKFWPSLVVIGFGLAIIAFAYIYIKMRRRK